MIFFDTECCGLHGPIVLLQWAKDDGPIQLHSVWTEPVQDTLDLIEEITNDDVCGFNLAFDWFHICQLYTTLSLLSDKTVPPNVTEYALKEPEGRFGLCLKPRAACDVMLVARQGKYQATMERKPIRIKRIPAIFANEVAAELTERIKISDIYFARYADPTRRWQVQDIYDSFGDIIPDFKDLVLNFSPSSALKALAHDALGVDMSEILLFGDAGVPAWATPEEVGYAPFALAIGKPGDWNKAWPQVIERHISHWTYNARGRKYAEDDVKYTRDLWRFFGSPEPGDVDSDLACMVGAVRWRGFKINVDGMKQLRDESIVKINKMKSILNFESPASCRAYLEEVLSSTEQAVLKHNDKITTKATVLEIIAKWTMQDVCECAGFKADCLICNGSGLVKSDTPHPAAIRARELLEARHAKKELDNYEKLVQAGRFHASFKVIGTLSGRMAGGDDLNAQGIKRAKYVRQNFPLADDPFVLYGGDFESFEVVIAANVFKDPKLLDEQRQGKKLHALFAMCLFPGKTYEEIMKTKGAPNPEQDLYTRGKNGVFAMLYGGEAFTLMNRVGISDERIAEEAYQRFLKSYPGWAMERKKYFDMFCSMRQPNGIGTKVEWHEPSEYVESIFGFRRYFTLENQICKVLFELANKLPDYIKNIKMKVTRRDREQTVGGAVCSALYAAAFALQAANMRAAANHVIQSPGATMTKILQHRLWGLQPVGVGQWCIQPMNVHDEILAPIRTDFTNQSRQIVKDFLEEYGKIIELLGFDWDRKDAWA